VHVQFLTAGPADEGAAQAGQRVFRPLGGLLEHPEPFGDQVRGLGEGFQHLGGAAQELLEEVLRAELVLEDFVRVLVPLPDEPPQGLVRRLITTTSADSGGRSRSSPATVSTRWRR